MAQYGSIAANGTGTTVTTNGTAVITGSGTLWSTSPLVVAGNLFTIDGNNYEIGSVDSETQLTLTSVFAGADDSGQIYVVSSAFTANHGLAYTERGDVETAALNKRAISGIDTLLGNISSDGLTFSGVAAGYLAGNGLYNGKMTFSQRGDYTSPTAISSNTYYLDRWKSTLSGISATVQDVGGSQRLTATTTTTGSVGMTQQIEGYAKYASKQITVSALVTSNSVNSRLLVNDGAGWVGSNTHSGGGGEELLSVTTEVQAGVTVLQILPFLGGTAGGNTAITLGDYIEFTDVRLDLGEYRLSGDREYSEELALCQRYYFFDGYNFNGMTGIPVYIGLKYSTNLVYGFIPTPVSMRTTPTVAGIGTFTIRDGAGSDGSATFSSVLGFNNSGISVIFSTTLSPNATASIAISANNTAGLTFNAEL